jgi:hypothetical protein
MRTLASIEPKRLRKITAGDMALRFAFGAAASVIAGTVSIAFGARAGGVFLAFPAILPASLTLIEKKEGLLEATQDVVGAVIGSVGLLAFAVVGGAAIRRFNLAVAVACALVAWLAVAVLVYTAVEIVRRRIHEHGAAANPSAPPEKRAGAA